MKKHILVTGSVRSGTTFVGKMIALSPSVRYIHEPFNRDCFTREKCLICNFPKSRLTRFKHLYQGDPEEYLFYRHIKHKFFYPRFSVPKPLNNSNPLEFFKSTLKNIKEGVLQTRRLFKDPLAFFSAEWLASKFNMIVIVMIRHPAAFVNSCKRVYSHIPAICREDLRDLARQPELAKMISSIEPDFSAELNQEFNVIIHSSIFWKIVYYIVNEYKKNHPDWLFLRYEDVSRNPINWFGEIFKRLGLPFEEEIKKKIIEFTGENGLKIMKNFYGIERISSQKNINDWKNNLASSEIERIKEITGDVSRLYYSESDWQ